MNRQSTGDTSSDKLDRGIPPTPRTAIAAPRTTSVTLRRVRIESAGAILQAELALPRVPTALVVFAHPCGSTHAAPRCHRLADHLHRAGLGTLLCDLLTRCEEARDVTHGIRFDIDLLTERLVGVIDWLQGEPATRELAIGLFGANTGAAAALCASVRRPECVHAIVGRGGRPDLAEEALAKVSVPTLLIVGAWDDVVLQLNREALHRLPGERRLEIVAHATHLFDEPGALEEVARCATRWFVHYLQPAALALPS